VSAPLLVYGANGYTGRIVTDALLARGIRPTLCGRNARAVASLAERHGLPYCAADLDDAGALDAALADVEAVVHCAGPFSTTARPMLDACLRQRVHYLDVTGEVPVLEAAAGRGPEARARGITLLPGVGFDVVPTDCLAAHVARRLPRATHLRLAVTGLDFASHGSARTLIEQVDRTIWVRREGRLARALHLEDRPYFDFGEGPRATVNVSWGDVVTAYYTTGIPNVSVYFERTVPLETAAWAGRLLGAILRTGPAQAWMKAHVDFFGGERSAEERALRTMVIVAEARASDGSWAASRLRTPEAYAFTGSTAATLAARVLGGDLEPGFQTPARVYGADFILGWPGVSREDLDG
jgi:short subunit dehydrogenase-like uncharacterized protein